MGSAIIGIDHGYKNMKSVNAMLATRLSLLESKPGLISFVRLNQSIGGKRKSVCQ